MPFYTGHLPAATNRADYLFAVELFDQTTNDFVDFTDHVITVALSLTTKSSPALTGTTADGHITVTGPGVFEVHFTRNEMAQFAAGDLDMGITTLHPDGNTYQLFSGQLPVVDGVVAR